MKVLKNNRLFDFLYGGKRFRDLESTQSFTEEGDTLTTVYTLPDGLKVTNVAKKYGKYGAYEWVNQFENTSEFPSEIISQLWDCDFTLPMEHEDPYKHTTFLADKNTATKIYAPIGSTWTTMEFYCNVDQLSKSRYDYYIYPGETKAYKTSGGRSSEERAPFFNIYKNGRGVIFAIGWTGQWNCEISRGQDDITFRSKIEDTNFRLMPGEKVRTSSVVVMPYKGTVTEAGNKWRRLVKEHFSLIGKEGRATYGSFCTGTWGGMPTKEMLKRIDIIKENKLLFEYFWIDAGWYGMSEKLCIDEFEGDWSQHTGDWRVNPHIHPDGLKEVSAAVHEAGMKLVLWLEPERVINTTPTAVTHPEYFLGPVDDRDSNRLLNLGNPVAWNYCFDTLTGIIDELNINCYRQDFNISPLEFWRKNDTADRKGITEIKHINGLYRLWDALLERFPHLIIDNCASGGRRIDIETLRRSVPLWRSDATCPALYPTEIVQTHNQTFNVWMPYSGTSPGQSCDIYRVRSAYSSCMSTNFLYSEQDYPEVIGNQEKYDQIRAYCEEYLSVRPYLSEDFYPLTEPCDKLDTWSAVQFDSPEMRSGIVQVFRREKAPYTNAVFQLGGIKTDKVYTFRDADDGSEFVVSGQELAEQGFSVTILEKRTAKLYFYAY